MARGTTIQVVRQMVKAECLVDLDSDVSAGGDAMLNVLLSNQQKWLALQYDWPFLNTEKTVSLVAGTRYYTLPAGLEYGRAIEADVYWSTLWSDVEQGISAEDYNLFDPAQDHRSDPIEKWEFYNDSGTLKLEVWPIPATAATLRLTGQSTLAAFATDGDVCTLDDLLIAQFTAARLLAKKGAKDAQAMLSQAQETLRRLRAGYPSPNTMFQQGLGRQNGGRVHRSQRPIVGVNYSP